MGTFKRVLACALLLPVATAWSQDDVKPEPTDAVKLEEIEVIGTTPYAGSEISLEEYPGGAQTADAEDIDQAAVINFNTFLNNYFGSVHVTDAVNNPFKPDLHYRGYVVSPLLGLPQGLTVWQDGVRINEPFGDAVNFSFIPMAAIASVDLIPGANPLYGLNTLGGAISIQTKDGFSHPGLEVQAYAGSFGRRSAYVAYGGHQGNVGYFLLAQTFEEDGWRDHSHSEVNQFFGKLTVLTQHGEINFSVTMADNTLRGNGAVPVELAKLKGRDAVFTYPDQTKPELMFFNLRGIRHFTEESSLSWGVYYRSSDKTTFNGDASEFAECVDKPGFLCVEGEELVYTPAGRPVEYLGDEFVYGTQNTSSLEQDGYGLSLQLTTPGLLDGELITGLAVNYATASYSATQEIARLTAERGTEGLGTINARAITRVDTETMTYSVFALHRMPLFTPAVNWTIGGRYNYNKIELNDRTPTFPFLGPDTTSLDGEHTFKRLNLFTGLTWDVTEHFTVYGNVGQSSRTPTPLELACANPDAPCRLPIGLVDDPPLDPVVATTVALGARGDTKSLDWRVTVFSAWNNDAIRFQATENQFKSFFTNIDETVHQGIELGVTWHITRALRLSADYTYLNAEFGDSFYISSPNNPADPTPNDPTIKVEEGDRIPLVPKHIFNVAVDWQATDKLTLGMLVTGNSEQIFRGDEGNVDSARVDGFAIVNVRARYEFTDNFAVFARANNLFDTEYSTFGVYGESGAYFLPSRIGDNPRFIAPGAPRSFFVGMELEL